MQPGCGLVPLLASYPSSGRRAEEMIAFCSERDADAVAKAATGFVYVNVFTLGGFSRDRLSGRKSRSERVPEGIRKTTRFRPASYRLLEGCDRRCGFARTSPEIQKYVLLHRCLFSGGGDFFFSNRQNPSPPVSPSCVRSQVQEINLTTRCTVVPERASSFSTTRGSCRTRPATSINSSATRTTLK